MVSNQLDEYQCKKLSKNQVPSKYSEDLILIFLLDWITSLRRQRVSNARKEKEKYFPALQHCLEILLKVGSLKSEMP